MIELNKIYNESNLHTMAKMPDNFIDLTVTSPPYDNLRDYKGYQFDFERVAQELYRVTKEGGIVVWVVGDATINGSETLTSFKQAIYFKEKCGFNLHDTMIYHRQAANPPNNRYWQNTEYMFVLSKGKPETLNLLKDKKNKYTKMGGDKIRQKNGEIKKGNRSGIQYDNLGYRGNIWYYSVGGGHMTKDDVAYKHPAIFPEALARDHILSWSNEFDLVYDPFMGSGTVAKMCILTNRNYVGSEISKGYCEIAEKRLQPYLDQFSLFENQAKNSA